MPNLPQILPTSSDEVHPVSSVHDQAFTGEEQATSISDMQAPDEKAVGSISEIHNKEDKPLTSISTMNAPERQRVELEEAVEVEEEPVVKEKEDPYALHVGGTGHEFRDTGFTGFKRRFGVFFRKHRFGAYGNLSKSDKAQLHDIIANRMHHKLTGSEVGLKDRLVMRGKAWRLYQNRKITRSDYNDFKKVIGRLKG